nr:hypothetical protein [Acidimicrobiia bacterium]
MRDRLDELDDAEVVLVLFTAARNLRGYRSRLALPYSVVTSEDRSAYRDYGLPRGSMARVWGWRTVREYGRLLRKKDAHLERPTEDTLQLGGDFVVGGDGRLVYAFRSEGPDDRPPVDDLVAAVSRA